MIKKLITLFKLGRKVAKSDILNITSKFQEPPLVVKFLFKFLSFSFSPKKYSDLDKDEGERLSNSLESMGTTFIKLGQFLATRPDIIGEELSKKLENIQDRLIAIDNSIISAAKYLDKINNTINCYVDNNNNIYLEKDNNEIEMYLFIGIFSFLLIIAISQINIKCK